MNLYEYDNEKSNEPECPENCKHCKLECLDRSEEFEEKKYFEHIFKKIRMY